MVYGYARVSTKTQAKDGNSLEVQENALRAAGAAEVYADAFTGTKSRRPELDKLLRVMFFFTRQQLYEWRYTE